MTFHHLARPGASLRLRVCAIAAGALGALAIAAPAGAATAPVAQWSCSASAVRATVANQTPIEPIVANRTPCADATVGLPKLTDALGLAPSINARTAYALTTAKPSSTTAPIKQSVGSASGVENLTLESAGNVVIGAEAIRSEASGYCKANNTPAFNSYSQVVGLTINGQKIDVDQVLQPITDAISNSPLSGLIEVRLNEKVQTANGLVIRGAHIKVLNAAGTAPLADIVIAESTITSSEACNPNAIGNNGTTVGSSTNTGGVRVCPQGAVLDAANGVCIITAANSGGQGVVVIGPPYTGPSGGTVISLNVARKKYHSICLTGPGPKYAIVGTNHADRITGTNGPDRILLLGGNDHGDGGRGNDCQDGGTGGDTILGGLGNDRLYGQSGKDHVNGDSGKDYESAGSGNDTINAGFGQDTAKGGSGNDAINAATAGKPAFIDCGAGTDKLRINPNEMRHQRNCEIVHVFSGRK